MRREDIADLAAFVTIAEERSFTRAARRLGITQSALSQIIRRLESRLDIRLLARTTRSVAPTEAGMRLMETMGPMLREIESRIDDIQASRDSFSGTIRITAVEHAARNVLYPKIAKLVSSHPDITVEIFIDYGLSDVVADRFDAGVRLGEHVAKDMIAVRLGPDIPMTVVGSPAYLDLHGTPDLPGDLVEQRCINLRLPTSDTTYAWRFVENGQTTRINVEGPLVFNSIALILDAALDGTGLAYLPADFVAEEVGRGNLLSVLEEYIPPLPGYHLYYPSRRQNSPAFKLMVESLRHRA
jgi:DNA-binding transcriptional LysR family regulator